MPFFTVREKLLQHIETALDRLHSEGYLPSKPPTPQLDAPKQAGHGDFACTVAMALAKPLKKNPRDVAQKILDAVGNAEGLVAKAEIAGPGFMNFFVAEDAWRNALAGILEAGQGFLRSDAGRGERVLIEFVSANPTGPLHIAHGRGAATGDVLGRLMLAAGYNVEREYYINDVGNQIDVLGRSIYLRYAELFGRTFTPPEDFYPGDYVTDVARRLKDELSDKYLDKPEEDWLQAFRERGMAVMMDRIRADLDAFGVSFDRFVSEREVTERAGLADMVKRLEKSGHVYEKEGKKWFKTTDFGDDKDRVVIREDGRPTYFATDILYHDDKMRRGFARLINIWGADHAGYIQRVKAGLTALGYPGDPLEVILVQMVSLSRGGESVRMGKRLGTAVWLREVVEEAGRDATRYFFLLRRSDSQLDFDIELATKKSIDNPVYYAQMGHARMCSIERRAAEAGIKAPELGPGALDALVLPEELDLIKALERSREVVANAAREREPHLVAHHIQELIAQFHSYYTKYKGAEKVVSDDPVKTRARLLLCRALRMTLFELLGLLGVSAPERMSLAEEDGDPAAA